MGLHEKIRHLRENLWSQSSKPREYEKKGQFFISVCGFLINHPYIDTYKKLELSNEDQGKYLAYFSEDLRNQLGSDADTTDRNRRIVIRPSVSLTFTEFSIETPQVNTQTKWLRSHAHMAVSAMLHLFDIRGAINEFASRVNEAIIHRDTDRLKSVSYFLAPFSELEKTMDWLATNYRQPTSAQISDSSPQLAS